MQKLIYVSPEVKTESLCVDSSFALGCGTEIPYSTVSCLSGDDYEVMTEIWGFPDTMPLDASDLQSVIFSSDVTCLTSCYQGPYDSFYAS